MINETGHGEENHQDSTEISSQFKKFDKNEFFEL